MVVIILITLLPGKMFATISHNDISTLRCLDCHKKMPFGSLSLDFYDDIDKVCFRCHDMESNLFSHPVGVKVKNRSLPPGMVLNSKGEIICITCHTFHKAYYIPDFKRKSFLRRTVTGKRFCISCHKTDPFTKIK